MKISVMASTELACIFLSGYFIGKKNWLAIIFFVIGIILAVVTGEKIKRKGGEEYGLEKESRTKKEKESREG